MKTIIEQEHCAPSPTLTATVRSDMTDTDVLTFGDEILQLIKFPQLPAVVPAQTPAGGLVATLTTNTTSPQAPAAPVTNQQV